MTAWRNLILPMGLAFSLGLFSCGSRKASTRAAMMPDADLVIVDTDKPQRVTTSNLLSKCQWSPFEGHEFSASIDTTIINGEVVYSGGKLSGIVAGQKLKFGRAR